LPVTTFQIVPANPVRILLILKPFSIKPTAQVFSPRTCLRAAIVDVYQRYWSLTLLQLREEVNRRNLHSLGNRKADFIRALATADHITSMANPLPGVQWVHLSDNCITDAIDRLGLVFAATPGVYADNRQGRVQFLGDIGLQPWQCLPLPNMPVGPGAAAPPPPVAVLQAPPTPKLPDLKKQDKDETVRAFLGRLDGFLVIANLVTDTAKLHCLYGAANTMLSNFVTAQVQGGTLDYATIRQRAIDQFEPSFVLHLQLYQSARKTARETFPEFGQRIRAHYLGYLQQDEGQITPIEEVNITKALISQALSTVSMAAQSYMNSQLLQQPAMTWHAFLTQLEAFAAARRPVADGQSSSNSNRSSYRRTTQPGNGKAPPTCFTCGQTGHTSPSCPQRQGHGNAVGQRQGNGTGG
jgi:hypothetical protein